MAFKAVTLKLAHYIKIFED